MSYLAIVRQRKPGALPTRPLALKSLVKARSYHLASCSTVSLVTIAWSTVLLLAGWSGGSQMRPKSRRLS